MPIKTTTQSFARNTTIHGLNELFQSNSRLTKFIWGTILVISAMICAWQLYITITEYQRAPTSMKSYVKPLTEFPTAYFHILNCFDQGKIKELGLTQNHTYMILDSFPAAELSRQTDRRWATEFTPKELEKMREDILQVQRDNNFADFGDLVRAISHPPGDFFDFWDEGGIADISIHLDESGVSYAFNKNVSSDELEVEGRGFGMAIWVSAEAKTYSTEARGRISTMRPVFMSVGTDSHEPSKWQLLDLSTYDMVLEPQVIKSIPTKTKPCSREYESVQQCRYLCKAKKQVCGKGCEWFVGQKMNQTTRLCVNPLDRDPTNGSCMGDCNELCTPPCDIWNYNLHITVGTPYSEHIFVGLIMGSPKVLVFEESFTYSSSTLFSNIGGILSLYLGASVLSFMHVLYFWTCKARIEKIDTVKA